MRMSVALVGIVLLHSTLAQADARNDKRTELMTRETLRIMKRAESQTALTGKDFANVWRRSVKKAIKETCACRDRYVIDRKLRAHCAMDAMSEMMLDIMPVLFRVPGVLDGWKKAIEGTAEEADAYGEKVTTDLLEEWVPAKERLRTMKQLHECFE
jgi:hypothetical protein